MIDNVIFYFSGTGNSLDVARHIAEQIGNTMLISMSENPYEIHLKSKNRVGFVFPTYYSGLPRIAEHFISHIPMTEDIYSFAVTTCARQPGNALKQVNYILQSTDYQLSYGSFVKTVNSDIISLDSNQNIEKLLANSYAQLKPIIEDILKYQTNQQGIVNPILSLLHQSQLKKAMLQEQYFEVSPNCNHCGICHDVCPVDNIELIDGKPLFHHHCEGCMACIQYCPVGALNYRKLTVHKEKYHHPAVPANEFADSYQRTRI